MCLCVPITFINRIKANTQALRSLHTITSNKRWKQVEMNQKPPKKNTQFWTIQRKGKTLIPCVKVG